MGTKRYMNEEGKIVSNYRMVPCKVGECGSCPNAKKNNGLYVYCGAYFIKDPGAWMKNRGYREIFELENYQDKGYVMVCHNLDQSKMFARFLAKNGRKWDNGESYLDDNRCCFNIYPATNFLFNQNLRVLANQDYDWDGNKLIRLDFENYVFKMEDKKMEKKQFTVKDLKAGMRVQHRDGSTALLVPMADGSLMKLYATQPMWGDIRFYDESLNKITDHDLDIMRVFPPVTTGNDFKSILTDPMWLINPIWTREEAKEMTVAEIEKELGYSIKVVK